MNLNELSNVTYIAMETFRKNGEGVITPVWVTGENDQLFVWTDLDSWKVKRIRKDNRVRVCESDSRGNPKSEWLDAKARIIDTEEAVQKAQTQFLSKYGIQFRGFKFLGRKKPKTIIEISGE